MERTPICLECGKTMRPFVASVRKFCDLICLDKFEGIGHPLTARERIDVLVRLHGLPPYDKFEKINQ